jgi:hypothetical protein
LAEKLKVKQFGKKVGVAWEASEIRHWPTERSLAIGGSDFYAILKLEVEKSCSER